MVTMADVSCALEGVDLAAAEVTKKLHENKPISMKGTPVVGGLDQIKVILKKLDRNREHVLGCLNTQIVETRKTEGMIDYHAYAHFCPSRKQFKFYELAYDNEKLQQVLTVKKYFLTKEEACFELMQCIFYKNYQEII
jgi:hypothetical protein